MHRGERGGLGAVHGDAGPVQSEVEGEPAGEHRPLVTADQAVQVEPAGPGLAQPVPVVGVRLADEDGGGAAGEVAGVAARVLQGLPGGVQQQPLLRVHGGGLVRRDAEELRVELVDAVHEAAAGSSRGRCGPGREAVRRCDTGGVLPGTEQFPEPAGSVRARQTAADPDHGDRVGLRYVVRFAALR